MPLVPTNTTAEWGQIRVTVDGKDRTFFRDIETVVESWQDTDPYGPNNARLSFPQVTPFENAGTGDLDWLDTGKRVRIDHHSNGVRVKNLFIGFIDRIELGDAGVSVTCVGDLTGYLAMKLHQPPIGRRQVRDAAEAIRHEIGAHDGHSRFDVPAFETGIDVAVRGDRAMTQLGFVDYCLGMAIKANGDSLTILPDPATSATAYTLGWRDLTSVHATVDYGAHGVKVSLSKDLVDHPNRIYGEGVSTTGERWRNAKSSDLHNNTAPAFPMAAGQTMQLGTANADTTTGGGVTTLVRQLAITGELAAEDKYTDTFTDEVEDAVIEVQKRARLTANGVVDATTWDRIFNVGTGPKSFAGSMFWPLAFDERTMKFVRTADGTIIGDNDTFDPHLIHVEEFESYGESTPKRRARRNANAKLNRKGGWAGTLTLTSDPAEMSRFDLRAGMNIAVRHLKGAALVLLHISSVQVDWKSGTVTLAVSTQGRHYLDLATRKERNREARRDPGMAFRHMLRRSAQTSDAISGWEGESGAGIITPTPLTGGTWNIVKFVACEVGTASNLRLEVDAPTEFYAALFATRISAADLNAHIGDPSVWVDAEDEVDVWTENAGWLVSDVKTAPWGLDLPDGKRERLMITAWGTPNQPCGYWPKPYLNPTGARSKAPVTGKQRDDGSFDFWTEDNFLYLAVWPVADCTIEGRMRIQINEGA